MSGLDTVSYTHLDVYKRQVQSGEKMSEKDEQLLASPASVLMLEKQRNGEGWEGGVPLSLIHI